MFSVVCVPFIAYHYAADNWTVGSITCKLWQYLTYVTTYVTVYTLVAVAIVRVCKVTMSRDERHQSSNAMIGRSIQHVSLVVGALWIVALTANLPVFFSYRIKTFITSLNDSDIEPYKYCGIEDATKGRRIVSTFFVLAYVAPLTVIASMYFMLLYHLRRHARHSSISARNCRPTSQQLAGQITSRASTIVSRRASHVTRVLVVVVVVFAACWLPLHIHLLVAYCGIQPAQRWYEVYRVMAHCLAYANCCMNPVIYSYVSSDFRHRFSDVMSCHRHSSTANSAVDQPELSIMCMRNASCEAIVVDPRGHYFELHEAVDEV